MKTAPHSLVLLGLLGAWMLVAWPHLAEQYSTTVQARAALAPLDWEERTAALDQPGYAVAQEIAKAVPASACVLILSRAGPEHLRYYRSRFAYYLYPRRFRLPGDAGEPGVNCEYLAVFRDLPQNLAQEPFRGRWDERQLAARTAAMTKLVAGEQVEVYRAR